MASYKRIILQEGVDGLVMTVDDGAGPQYVRVREKHAATPTKHVEEALEAIGAILVGEGYVVNVAIRPA